MSRYQIDSYLGSDELLARPKIHLITSLFETDSHILAENGYYMRYRYNHLNVTYNRIVKFARSEKDIEFFLRWKSKTLIPPMNIDDLLKECDLSGFYDTSRTVKLQYRQKATDAEQLLNQLLNMKSESEIISMLNTLRLNKLDGWRPELTNDHTDDLNIPEFDIPELQYVVRVDKLQSIDVNKLNDELKESRK